MMDLRSCRCCSCSYNLSKQAVSLEGFPSWYLLNACINVDQHESCFVKTSIPASESENSPIKTLYISIIQLLAYKICISGPQICIGSRACVTDPRLQTS